MTNTQINSSSTVDDFLQIDDDLKSSAMSSDSSPREITSEQELDNSSVTTKHTVITSPWSRLLVIALPFGLTFLAIFWLLNGIFNPDNRDTTKTIEEPKSSETKEQVEQTDGDIYAKLALNQQEDELNKINQSKQEVKVNNKPVSVAASPPPIARPVAQTQSLSPRRYYVPSRTNPTISSPPRNQTLPRISNPFRTVTPKTETPTDVIAEFNRLRSLGSYGKIAYTPTSNNQQISTEATSFQTPNTTRIQVQPPNSAYTTQQTRPNFSNSTSTEIEKIRPRWLADSKSDKQVADGNYLSQENQILQQRKTRYLVVGEFANGVLVTPVVKQQSENTRFQQQQAPDDSKRYVARLTADLHDNYGNVAIHKGTLLAVEPLQVNGGSYVSVQVTSIIKDNTEYPISSGAISVLGEGGKPLLAKQFQDKKGGGSDLTVGLVSGLGQVGTILNQSDSSSSVINSATGTFSSSTTSNSQRNIGGAFLQGAFGKLSDIIARRAETSNQEITARPNVWYIPQGTKITFLVNRSLELP